MVDICCSIQNTCYQHEVDVNPIQVFTNHFIELKKLHKLYASYIESICKLKNITTFGQWNQSLCLKSTSKETI